MIQIFDAVAEDIGAITAIEATSHRTQFVHRDFERALTHPKMRLLVARQTTGEVVGHGLLQIVADELEILTFAVAPTSQRQGVGRALLQHAIRQARGEGVTRAFLEVRESNLAAQALYTAEGFSAQGRRPSYYRDGEAAIVMNRSLT